MHAPHNNTLNLAAAAAEAAETAAEAAEAAAEAAEAAAAPDWRSISTVARIHERCFSCVYSPFKS